MGALDGLPPKTAAAAANAAETGRLGGGDGRRERGDAVANRPYRPTARENIPKHVLDRFKDRPPGRDRRRVPCASPRGFRGRRGFSRIPGATYGYGAVGRSRSRPLPRSRCRRRRFWDTVQRRRGRRMGSVGCAVCAGTADVAFTRETPGARGARYAPSVLRTARGGGGRDGCVGCAATRTEKGKANTPAVLAARDGAPRLGETLVRGKNSPLPRCRASYVPCSSARSNSAPTGDGATWRARSGCPRFPSRRRRPQTIAACSRSCERAKQPCVVCGRVRGSPCDAAMDTVRPRSIRCARDRRGCTCAPATAPNRIIERTARNTPRRTPRETPDAAGERSPAAEHGAGDDAWGAGWVDSRQGFGGVTRGGHRRDPEAGAATGGGGGDRRLRVRGAGLSKVLRRESITRPRARAFRAASHANGRELAGAGGVPGNRRVSAV